MAAKTLVTALLVMGLSGSVLTVGALFLCAVLDRLHAPGRWVCLIWLALGLRFLLPGILPVSVPGADSLSGVPAVYRVQETVQRAAAQNPATPATETAGYFLPDIWCIAAMVWGIGTAVTLLRAAVCAHRLERRVALAWRTPDGCYTCGEVTVPFTKGLFCPRIYMPQSVTGTEREAISLHERAHIRRGDTVTRPLFYLAVCLHWWNPLAHLAFRQFERAQETACDEAAAANRTAAERVRYCESLLRFASGGQSVPGTLSFGQGGVEGRVAHLLRYRAPGRTALAVCAVLVLLGCGFCVLRPEAQSPAPSAEPDAFAVIEETYDESTVSGEDKTLFNAEFFMPVSEYWSVSAVFSAEHPGIDYCSQAGTPVLAAANGVAEQADYTPDDGFYLLLDHGTDAAGNRYQTRYSHLQSLPLAAVGERVTGGQVIGAMGSSGASTGNHLHFELLVNGQAVDPAAYGFSAKAEESAANS